MKRHVLAVSAAMLVACTPKALPSAPDSGSASSSGVQPPPVTIGQVQPPATGIIRRSLRDWAKAFPLESLYTGELAIVIDPSLNREVVPVLRPFRLEVVSKMVASHGNPGEGMIQTEWRLTTGQTDGAASQTTVLFDPADEQLLASKGIAMTDGMVQGRNKAWGGLINNERLQVNLTLPVANVAHDPGIPGIAFDVGDTTTLHWTDQQTRLADLPDLIRQTLVYGGAKDARYWSSSFSSLLLAKGFALQAQMRLNQSQGVRYLADFLFGPMW